MPKEIKGNAGRKPPEPSANHADIADWLRRQMPHLQPILQALDESIRATIPHLHYALKWKRPYYGLPELGWIIELAAYDVSVNVVFFGGADFDSPPPLGTTDRTRYIKVTSLEEAQRPELHAWIEEASRTPGWSWGGRTKVAPPRKTRRRAATNEAPEPPPLRAPLWIDPLLTFMVRRGSVKTVAMGCDQSPKRAHGRRGSTNRTHVERSRAA
jgi:hypothetical protein